MITLSPTFIRSVRLFVLEYFKALSQLRRATLAAPFTGSKSGRSPAHQRILAKLDLGARSRSCGSCFFCFAPGPASALPHVRFRGRYWGQSEHDVLHCICLLLTQSGHSHDALDT